MTWEGASNKKDTTYGDGTVSAKATAGTFTVNWGSFPSIRAWEHTLCDKPSRDRRIADYSIASVDARNDATIAK